MSKKIRLEGYDYSRQGLYFITICCKDRVPHLSTIEKKIIHLTPIGEQLAIVWNELNSHYPHAEPWDYVIMPDHFHGIIHIHTGSLKDERKAEYGKPLSRSVSVMVNGLKGAITRWAKINHFENFQWQPKFFDTIIRDNQHLWNVQNYIANNPLKWEEDDGIHRF